MRKITHSVPSVFVKDQALKIIPYLTGPIADIACGDGRNIIPFLSVGLPVHGYDTDQGRLEILRQRRRDNIFTEEVDLLSDEFSLTNEYFSLIIQVHFYNQAVFRKMITAIMPGGFIIFETVNAHGGNYTELPKKGEVLGMLDGKFKIWELREGDVGISGHEKMKLLGQRALPK